MSIEIKIRKNEPVDRALRRMKKKLDRENIIKGTRAKRYYEKPCEKRRRKEKVQAFTNAVWRAMQWIKANNPDAILGSIERYVGSTSKDANLLEIGELKDVADWSGLITPESYARGEKVWYGEFTGIMQPVKMEDAVSDKFLKAAHAKYPA